ncbi:hypothetical protein FVE85_5649 [Porphyridium purpureum]|uniref:BAR domain-containing protein n=1 Tax=Porphyridium purpureum TaxID=35688 RepID=A0A5J4Z523_PORPP|nr:hypothetical protein FVE85_5649 [Porphyridium purpureum]|eukprot:POR5555..scf295_1
MADDSRRGSSYSRAKSAREGIVERNTKLRAALRSPRGGTGGGGGDTVGGDDCFVSAATAASGRTTAANRNGRGREGGLFGKVHHVPGFGGAQAHEAEDLPERPMQQRGIRQARLSSVQKVDEAQILVQMLEEQERNANANQNRHWLPRLPVQVQASFPASSASQQEHQQHQETRSPSSYDRKLHVFDEQERAIRQLLLKVIKFEFACSQALELGADLGNHLASIFREHQPTHTGKAEADAFRDQHKMLDVLFHTRLRVGLRKHVCTPLQKRLAELSNVRTVIQKRDQAAERVDKLRKRVRAQRIAGSMKLDNGERELASAKLGLSTLHGEAVACLDRVTADFGNYVQPSLSALSHIANHFYGRAAKYSAPTYQTATNGRRDAHSGTIQDVSSEGRSLREVASAMEQGNEVKMDVDEMNPRMEGMRSEGDHTLSKRSMRSPRGGVEAQPNSPPRTNQYPTTSAAFEPEGPEMERWDDLEFS